MFVESVARRYARALFGAAQQRETLDTIKHELKEFVNMAGKKGTIHNLWFSSGISAEQKRNFIQKTFPNFSTLLLRFLFVLVNKHREKLLEQCLEEYQKLLLEFYNQVFVDVESPLTLPENIAKDLKNRLSLKLGKRVELVVSKNPSLLGGMVLRIGDRVVDGSLRTKLEGLREKLLR